MSPPQSGAAKRPPILWIAPGRPRVGKKDLLAAFRPDFGERKIPNLDLSPDQQKNRGQSK
jgi:hypothetical protein